MAMIGARQPGLFGIPPLDIGPLGPPIVAAPAQPMPQRQKGSWAGILADALAGAMGMPGQYAQNMERQKREQSEFERGEQQYRRQRADSRDDFLWKQQHEQRAPDEYTRMMDAAGIPAEQRPQMYQQALQRKLNPPRTIVMADGTVMELPSTASPFPAVPPAPIGPLTPISGGPTPQASGGFPYR